MTDTPDHEDMQILSNLGNVCFIEGSALRCVFNVLMIFFSIHCMQLFKCLKNNLCYYISS